jgi:hypothetical protein
MKLSWTFLLENILNGSIWLHTSVDPKHKHNEETQYTYCKWLIEEKQMKTIISNYLFVYNGGNRKLHNMDLHWMFLRCTIKQNHFAQMC